MAKRNNYKKRPRNDGAKRSDRKWEREDKLDRAEFSHTNDPSFYTAYEQLSKDAATFAYGIPLGTRMDLDPSGTYTESGTNYYNGKSIPGVCALHIIPCPGISKDNSSPINVAARNIYSFIRHANSGHANYDSPDLMMYLMAMDSIYSFYSWMMRTYGVLNVYSVKNRYFPRALVEANNINFDDLLANINDFRAWINTCSLRIGSLCVPATLRIFKRHIQMYQGYYTDANVLKAATYMYVPEGFYQYDEYNGAGQLKFISVHSVPGYSNKLTFSALRALFDSLLQPIIESEDMNIMSGDILKAYGDGNVVKLPQIAENYVVLPATDMAVLSQIQNSLAVGQASGAGVLDITQDPNSNAILWDPVFVSTGRGYLTDRVFTMYKDDVSPEDNFDATPLLPSVASETHLTGYSWELTLESCGTEVVSYYDVHWFEVDANGDWSLGNSSPIYSYNTMNANPASTAAWRALCRNLNNASKMEMFDYHPQVTYSIPFVNAGSEEFLPALWFWDVDNYTVIGRLELNKIHDAALLSEFTVQQFGLQAL